MAYIIAGSCILLMLVLVVVQTASAKQRPLQDSTLAERALRTFCIFFVPLLVYRMASSGNSYLWHMSSGLSCARVTV